MEVGEGEAEDPHAVDAALVEKMIAGSEAALGVLYERHAGTIYARAMRLTRDRSAA